MVKVNSCLKSKHFVGPDIVTLSIFNRVYKEKRHRKNVNNQKTILGHIGQFTHM